MASGWDARLNTGDTVKRYAAVRSGAAAGLPRIQNAQFGACRQKPTGLLGTKLASLAGDEGLGAFACSPPDGTAQRRNLCSPGVASYCPRKTAVVDTDASRCLRHLRNRGPGPPVRGLA